MPLLQAEHSGKDVRLVFIDDELTGSINGHDILTWDVFCAEAYADKAICLAIANSIVRERLAAQCHNLAIPIIGVQAQNCVIMDNVQIGEGALLSPFVSLTSNIKIGRCFHANLYSYVEHDCVIGDFVTFAPGVKCNGNVHIHDHAYIGAGAMLRQGKPGQPLIIGRGAIVGMGAVVIKDVQEGETVIGNPARRLIKVS